MLRLYCCSDCQNKSIESRRTKTGSDDYFIFSFFRLHGGKISEKFQFKPFSKSSESHRSEQVCKMTQTRKPKFCVLTWTGQMNHKVSLGRWSWINQDEVTWIIWTKLTSCIEKDTINGLIDSHQTGAWKTCWCLSSCRSYLHASQPFCSLHNSRERRRWLCNSRVSAQRFTS